jgi:hypothetical protein
MSLYTVSFNRSLFYEANVLYINTWLTSRVPWSVAVEVGDKEVAGLAADVKSVEFLGRVRGAVLKLPLRVRLPRHCSDLSFPRYYAIILRSLDPVEVEDVLGVRCDLSPTRWGYRFGFWHPRCQHMIARAIDPEIATITRAIPTP